MVVHVLEAMYAAVPVDGVEINVRNVSLWSYIYLIHITISSAQYVAYNNMCTSPFNDFDALNTYSYIHWTQLPIAYLSMFSAGIQVNISISYSQ